MQTYCVVQTQSYPTDSPRTPRSTRSLRVLHYHLLPSCLTFCHLGGRPAAPLGLPPTRPCSPPPSQYSPLHPAASDLLRHKSKHTMPLPCAWNKHPGSLPWSCWTWPLPPSLPPSLYQSHPRLSESRPAGLLLLLGQDELIPTPGPSPRCPVPAPTASSTLHSHVSWHR